MKIIHLEIIGTLEFTHEMSRRGRFEFVKIPVAAKLFPFLRLETNENENENHAINSINLSGVHVIATLYFWLVFFEHIDCVANRN